jgi:hypothetical protein
LPTTAPTEGTRGGGRGRSSTMIGRPLVAGELGAVNTWLNAWGGVLGVGGESTMMIRSFLCSRVARRIGSGRLALLDRRRRPSSEDDYSPERLGLDPPDERGGVIGRRWFGGKARRCWVSMNSVVGSPHWIFLVGFSSVEVLAHGRFGRPY